MAIKVTFVCLGNICRSPMAEAIFKHMVSQAGLNEQIDVDSCGTGSWHIGEEAHTGTQRILRQHHVPYNHIARQLTSLDLAKANYLIAMDSENVKGILRSGSTHAEIGLLLDYAPELDIREVPDPYYTNRFEEVYSLVEAGCAGLLSHLRKKEGI